MAFHELATNAVKYGALQGNEGWLNIQWRAEKTDDGNRLNFTWTESGGPPVSSPTAKCFGSRLIERGLAAELNGKAEIKFETS